MGQEHEFGDVEHLKGFQDLRPELSPETRDLVLAMRGLFQATGLSLRAFAATHHFGPASVCRYLKGDRIPDKQFLDVLMKSACRRNGREVTADLQARLYQRHRDALLSDQPARYREQMAGDSLEDAVLKREQAELRIRDLEQDLSHRTLQLSRLKARIQQIEDTGAHDRQLLGTELTRCEQLHATIRELEAELAEAVRERDAARARCAQLEADLAEAEEAAERERLERLVAEERLREAKAAGAADRHRADLDHARREAERVRQAAEREATDRREQAEAEARQILREAGDKAARAQPAVANRTAALRRLETVARDAAHAGLPRLAEELSRAHPDDVDFSVERFGIHAKGDVGDVARAFDRMLWEAVRLITEQARERFAVNAVCTDLAHRNMALFQDQLALLTDLETHETDPDQMEKLFRLDHLATRMRRNSEKLLALVGQEPGRRFDQPVLLIDVLRAAASEVEDYERIEPSGIPEAEIHGGAVADLVLLLAELLDNATRFSPSHTIVRVLAARLPDGRLMIEIHDRGIGMTAEGFADVNHRLATPPTLTPDVARRTGLFVVARLSARHGIRVQVRPSSDHVGTVSLVLLPDSVSTGRPAAEEVVG
ncbi:ATP-binding protein [Streptomyces sp. NPDC018693]|uniref:ATP-binding protein n=1 Tax=unclassified Streptomyces TaxID=2593676 RepID=UPI0037B018DF